MEQQIAKIMIVQSEMEKLNIKATRENTNIMCGCQSILDEVVSELRNICIEQKRKMTEGSEGEHCGN